MSTTKRDKRKAAQRKHQNRTGIRPARANRAETIAYARYLDSQKAKRAAPLVTEETVAKISAHGEGPRS